MKYQLVSPTLVPIGLLGLLESVGLDTTEKVHRAIEENALQSYRGIGPVRERKILHYYTTHKITYTK